MDIVDEIEASQLLACLKNKWNNSIQRGKGFIEEPLPSSFFIDWRERMGVEPTRDISNAPRRI